MISLNVYLTAKPDKTAALEKAIVDIWLDAMNKQPGFLRAAMNTPFTDAELDALEASKPSYTHEVVSYWESEQQRLDWVARDIHQEVWPQIVAHADSISYTLYTCDETWNM